MSARRTIRPLHDEVPCTGSPWRHNAITLLANRTMIAVVAVDEVRLVGADDMVRDVLSELERRGASVVLTALFLPREGLTRVHLRRAPATAGRRR